MSEKRVHDNETVGILPESGLARREEHESKIQRLEHDRLQKSVIVPTADEEVRLFLRALKEPVTLFGEGKGERRARLKSLLTGLDQQQVDALQASTENLPSAIVHQKPEGLFFTEGSDALKEFRVTVAKFSLFHARKRLENESAGNVGVKHENVLSRDESLRALTNLASELADTRPVVSCSFSPKDEYIAVASWSGRAKIWHADKLTVKECIQAHEDRLTSVAWHPFFDASFDEAEAVHLATGSVDCTAKLWSCNGTHLKTLEGHTQRLARIAMHPMGSHLGTCSFDQTWRLWDMETGECILEQEGHSRAVYALGFNVDGSLAVSGSLDGYARVWDLRSGRSITVLKGHAKAVLAVDFSPNGYMIATGSEDHTSRVYDLRKIDTVAVLPGHQSLISQVRFSPDGGYLLTTGYDNVGKIWCGKKFSLTKTLVGHEGKIMGSDLSRVGQHKIATVGYDRTLKVWEPDTTLLTV